MSRFRILRVVVSFALLFAATGCQKNTPVEPDPIVNYPLVTESYSGSIEKDGKKAFSFNVVNPGNINVSITSLSPVSTLTMGLGLGAWDAASDTCPELLPATGGARLNTVLTGSPQVAAVYCVIIYDIGNLPAGSPSEFTLTLTHY